MRKNVALGGILGILGVTLTCVAPALAQRPAVPTTLKGKVAAASKVPEAEVEKVLKALAPVIRETLASGQTVAIEGLGQFRVVRVAAHKDLVNGRPATIPPVNVVEFLPVGEMAEAANAKDAQPAETVPAFEYNPLPNQVKGLKTGRTRVPNIRTR